VKPKIITKRKHLARLAAACLIVLAVTACLPFPRLNAAVDEDGLLLYMLDGIAVKCMSDAGTDNIQGWVDSLSSTAGVTGDLYVMALSRFGLGDSIDFGGYAQSLENHLREKDGGNLTQRLNTVHKLHSVGADSEFFGEYKKSALSADMGEMGIMSLIYGLHLANCRLTADGATAEELAQELLALRLEDGGWALMGTRGDVDITAMTLQALAPLYDSDDEVRAAADGAVELLSGRQMEFGGFSSFGAENPESAAQVIIALTSLGIDPITDPRFVTDSGKNLIDGLMRFRLEDGSFCHAEGGPSSESATSQNFAAIVSILRLREDIGLTPFMVPDRDEPAWNAGWTPSQEAWDAYAAYLAAHPELQPEPAESGSPVKIIVCVLIGGAAFAVCGLLFALRKRHIKNYIFTLSTAALLIVIIMTTRFSTPEAYYSAPSEKGEIVGVVTIEIRCDTVADSKNEYIPEDGTILPLTEFGIAEGDTVYDILVEAVRRSGIHMETTGSAYINSLNHLYERQYGDLSGWVFHVNGISSSVGCAEYVLQPGDYICWNYTTEIGKDL